MEKNNYDSPSGTRARIQPGDDLFHIAKEALARLTTLDEKEYGTLEEPGDVMEAIVSTEKTGPLKLYVVDGTNSMTLAAALTSREEVYYDDGWLVVSFKDNELYVDYTEEGWLENHPGATSLCHFNQAYKDELIEKEWRCTDPDTEQWGRKVDDFTWEYFDYGEGPVAAETIDIRKYTIQQIQEAISPFGYTMVPGGDNNIQAIYGDSYIQIIAECIFEMDV